MLASLKLKFILPITITFLCMVPIFWENSGINIEFSGESLVDRLPGLLEFYGGILVSIGIILLTRTELYGKLTIDLKALTFCGCFLISGYTGVRIQTLLLKYQNFVGIVDGTLTDTIDHGRYWVAKAVLNEDEIQSLLKKFIETKTQDRRIQKHLELEIEDFIRLYQNNPNAAGLVIEEKVKNFKPPVNPIKTEQSLFFKILGKLEYGCSKTIELACQHPIATTVIIGCATVGVLYCVYCLDTGKMLNWLPISRGSYSSRAATQKADYEQLSARVVTDGVLIDRNARRINLLENRIQRLEDQNLAHKHEIRLLATASIEDYLARVQLCQLARIRLPDAYLQNVVNTAAKLSQLGL